MCSNVSLKKLSYKTHVMSGFNLVSHSLSVHPQQLHELFPIWINPKVKFVVNILICVGSTDCHTCFKKDK